MERISSNDTCLISKEGYMHHCCGLVGLAAAIRCSLTLWSDSFPRSPQPCCHPSRVILLFRWLFRPSQMFLPRVPAEHILRTKEHVEKQPQFSTGYTSVNMSKANTSLTTKGKPSSRIWLLASVDIRGAQTGFAHTRRSYLGNERKNRQEKVEIATQTTRLGDREAMKLRAVRPNLMDKAEAHEPFKTRHLSLLEFWHLHDRGNIKLHCYGLLWFGLSALSY